MPVSTSTARHVVVIHGDPNKPDEVLPGGKWDEDEFETLDRLKDALSSLSPDYKFTYLSNHDTLIDDLKHLKATTKIDLVFQLCDEGFNNHPRMELHAIAILEMLDLPFTGASSKCIGVTYDKQNVTSIAKSLGLPVPASVCIEDDKSILQHGLSYPVFIKPNSTDGSFGITAKSVCRNAADLLDALHDIRHRFTLTGPVLVQEYLEGIDVNVGVIGPDMKVLPITEEDYSALPEGLPKICGFESKWDETSPYWQLTSRPTTLTPEQQADVGAWSQKLFRRIDAHDYARFDWRMDSQGQPRFIEANPNCGWCWDGHLAKIAALAGHSYADMLRIIIESALERYAKANQARAQSPKKIVYLAHQLPAAPVEI